MKRKLGAALLLVAGIVGATYSGLRMITSPDSSSVVGDGLPNTPPSYAMCAWMWAYHPLPGPSAVFEEAVKVQIPGASASVQAYGEDCRYEDGDCGDEQRENPPYSRHHVCA